MPYVSSPIAPGFGDHATMRHGDRRRGDVGREKTKDKRQKTKVENP